MTLKQLHEALGNIIRDNETHGLADRNNLVVIVHFHRDTMQKQANPLTPSRFFPVEDCPRSIFTIKMRDYMTISIREGDEIRQTP